MTSSDAFFSVSSCARHSVWWLQAMLTGEVGAADVPAAWNERMRDYLGLTPPDDAQGCLQDIHWSGGAVGYFPTYTLGNLYAAQFYE